MRLTGIFVVLILMVGVLVFLTANLGQTVSIAIPFGGAVYENLNFHTVLIYTFSIGILLGFLFPTFLVFEFKMDKLRLERKLKKIQEELNNLRNVAIQEELEGEDITPRENVAISPAETTAETTDDFDSTKQESY